MRTASIGNLDSPEANDLPAMIATLACYESLFGPRDITTLSLAAHIAEILWGLGKPQEARSMLEDVVRNLGESVGRTDVTRISALHVLRDLLVEQADVGSAIAVQGEISECLTLLYGFGAPETITAISDLGELLISSSGNKPKT
jgi:hypothetical protein